MANGFLVYAAESRPSRAYITGTVHGQRSTHSTQRTHSMHSVCSTHLEALAKGADKDLRAGGAELAAGGLCLRSQPRLEDREHPLYADADTDSGDVLAAVHANQAVVPARVWRLMMTVAPLGRVSTDRAAGVETDKTLSARCMRRFL